MALENQLEAEQEYITHRLQKQVAQLASEKASLQRERGELQRQVLMHAWGLGVGWREVAMWLQGSAT